MNIIKNEYVGRTIAGDKVYLSIELRDIVSRAYSIEHKELLGYKELSISGLMVRKGGSITRDGDIYAAGQIVDTLRRVIEPAAGLSRSDIRRIVEIWDRWHLNSMRAKCAHQDNNIVWDKCDPCPITGYSAGSAWLVEEFPPSIVSELLTITDKLKVNKAIA